MASLETLVFFGKGGIGKSTISANLSAILASQGRRILHIGCDPKHDSTLALTGDVSMPTFQERHQASHYSELSAAEILVRGKFGIDCIEAGGPEPGLGCAGYGITQLLETLERLQLMRSGRYDTVVFDILGDIVCGGFAAPLRRGFAGRIFIVVSEEMAALYAANNIAKAVRTYAANGAVLGGLIVNTRDPSVDRAMLERFAVLLGTRILGFVPRDPAVRQAEYLRKTMLEHAPDSGFTAALKALARAATSVDAAGTPLPTPLEDSLFTELSLRQFQDPGGRAASRLKASSGVKAEAKPGAPMQRLGGPRSTAFFSRLLRLEDASWVLSSAFLTPEGCVGLGFTGRDRANVSVILKPLDSRGAFVATPNFGVCFQGTGGVDPAAEQLLHGIAARLGPAPLRTLQAVIERDPQAVGAVFAPAGPAVPGRKPGPGEPAALMARPAVKGPPPGLPLQFFFDETSAVGGFPQGSLFVHHGDWECWFIFLSGPFGFWERKLNLGTTVTGLDGPRVGQVSTDAGMRDVLDGRGPERLEAAIEAFLKTHPKPDMLVIRSYCLPMVLGDDVDRVLEKLRRKYGFAVTATNGLNPEIAILRSAMGSAFVGKRFAKAVPDPKKVNLIGFPGGESRQELAQLVEGLGLSVGQSLLPGWTYSGLERLPEAGLQVLSPRRDYAEVFAELAKAGGLRFVTPGSPYGLLATRAWLKGIAVAARRHGRFQKAFGERYAALRRAWRPLREAASGHSLGFVIPEADLPALSDAGSLGGLPLLPLVREMGFGVELFLWNPPAQGGRSASSAGPGFSRFSTAEELDDLLSQSACSAVYSDVCHDRRLLRHGKSRFSRFDFEPGFDGALRSLSRLLRLCRLPFHRRYERLWRSHGVQ
ncbi:MAG: nitrogenase component 1 [Elusimicrobiota bacterium]|jgi:nitrogenase iron protein NifH